MTNVQSARTLRRDDNQLEWSASDLALLGTMPDWTLADRMGITISTVRNKRLALGVVAWRARSISENWTKEKIAMLGTAPDEVLAREFGVTRQAVDKKRKAM